MAFSRLYTVNDVLAVVPVGRRTLQQIVAELGYRPPAGRKRLLFTGEQVEAIQGQLICREQEQATSKSTDLASGPGQAQTNGASPGCGSAARSKTSRSKGSSTKTSRDPLLDSILRRRRQNPPTNVVKLPDLGLTEG